MKIKILRIMEHERHWIHLFQFENVFQYIFADKKGKLYQHYIVVPTNPFRYLKFKLGLSETPFSKEEIEVGEQIILSGAVDSVEALILKQNGEEANLKTTSKIVNTLKKDPRCQWMARELENGMHYQCVNHDVLVKMVEGEVPFHEVTKDSKVLSPLQFEQ